MSNGSQTINKVHPEFCPGGHHPDNHCVSQIFRPLDAREYAAVLIAAADKADAALELINRANGDF